MNAHVRFILTLTLLFPLLLYAQGEQNIWMINRAPRGATNRCLDFNGGSPVLVMNMPLSASNAVCNAQGQPLFYTDGTNVFNRNYQRMPNGTDLGHVPSNGPEYSVPPVIIPIPGKEDWYGIATQRNGALYFSIVDITAAGGLGDVLPDHKKIPLNAFVGRDGIATDSKLTAIAGCNSTWLVSRSHHAKQFRAYEITAAGISKEPVISETGLLPPEFYPGYNFPGLLKASPDNRKLVMVCGLQGPQAIRPIGTGAIELYDFEKCSGRISNPVILDSGTHYYGACFSPDNTKLYATTREWPGKVYQFDLSLPTWAAVQASKTLVFTNTIYWVYSLYWFTSSDVLNDIKIGPDGKLYFTNGFRTPANAHLAPTTASPSYGHYLHVINEPNRAGLACNAVAEIMPFHGLSIDWPPDIVLPPKQDTVYGGLRFVAACFRDSISLQADTPGSCYRWDDGSDQPVRTVSSPGIYTIQYTDGHCALHIDSFDVRFVRLPLLAPSTYSCPNERQGSIAIQPMPGDTTPFSYAWKDRVGQLIKTRESSNGDSLSGLTSGSYIIQITTASGCDTTLSAKVLPLPLPVASFDGDTVVCKGQPLSFANTSDAPLWEWHFGNNTSSGERHPQHTYTEAGIQEAMLVVENIERCRDTLRKQIHVKHLELSLTVTPSVLHRNESVTLHTHAPEPYQVTAWLPEPFFADQHSFHQSIPIDTTRYFTVTAQSAYGCIDTATVLVTIHPVLFLPTAFSPNGDGRNDYFRPAIRGGAVTIRSFRIFDRWGREVWSGQGSAAFHGWDGGYNGVPAQVGTYYYTIEAETHTGETIRQKGDVILIR